MSKQLTDKDVQQIMKQAEQLKKSLEKVDVKGKLNKYKDYLADLAHKKLKSIEYKLKNRKSTRKSKRKSRKATRKSKRKSRKAVRKSKRKSRKATRKSKRKSRKATRK
jgi:hypothetical protein